MDNFKMSANDESLSNVASISESWSEIIGTENIVFLNVPPSLSKQEDFFAKFQYFGPISYCLGDIIGIYSKCDEASSTPLATQKFIVLDENSKTGKACFTCDDLQTLIDGQEYYFMYMHHETKTPYYSYKFIIDSNNTANETDDEASKVDSSEEEFIVISSQELKSENDELRSIVRQLELEVEKKNEEISSLRQYINSMGCEMKAVDQNMQDALQNSVKVVEALGLKLKKYGNNSEDEKDEMEMKTNIHDYLKAKLADVQNKMKYMEAVKQQEKSEALIQNLKARLEVGAELYKLQYLKIHELENEVADLKAKGEQACPPETTNTVNSKNASSYEDKKVDKLPKKCVIYFSDHADKELHIRKDHKNLESNGQYKNICIRRKTDEIMDNKLINDFDAKVVPNHECKYSNIAITELQEASSKDSEKQDACSTSFGNQHLSFVQSNNSPFNHAYFELKSAAKKFTPCLKNFLLDDPANMPNVPLCPSAPSPPLCDENIATKTENPVAETVYAHLASSVLPNHKSLVNSPPLCKEANAKDGVNPGTETVHANSNLKTVPYDDTELQSAECPYCNEIFYTIVDEGIMSPTVHGCASSLEQLWEHLHYKHEKDVCLICGAVCNSKDELEFKNHINSHF